MDDATAVYRRANAMNRVKSIGAGLLLLWGFWCLGRALETSLNRNPQVLEKRETVTAGVLLGLPAIAGGSWGLWAVRRQRRRQVAQSLRQIFFRSVQAGRGRVTPLQFAIAANLDGATATAYLLERSREYNATFDIDDDGNITYCFHLGPVAADHPLPSGDRWGG